MQIYLDEKGYVQLYALDEEYKEGNYIDVSNDYLTENFKKNYRCYKWENDQLSYKEERVDYLKKEEERWNIREQRKYVCFPIINRGELWYETITAEQRQELTAWYQAWLDAPQTLKMPDTPSWLA